jgi:hypothetical protein
VRTLASPHVASGNAVQCGNGSLASLQHVSPVALFECATTATGIRLIASCFGERFQQLRIFVCQRQHHLCGSAIAPQQLGHDAHRLIDVLRKMLCSLHTGNSICEVYEVTPALAAAGTHVASTDEMSSSREVAAEKLTGIR